MEVRYILVVVWITQQITDGKKSSEQSFNATDNGSIGSKEIYELLSLENESSTNNTELLSSKRPRREPPFTIIKHQTILLTDDHNPRLRRKFPRASYKTQNFKTIEPGTFYKPQISTYEHSNRGLHPSLKFDKHKHINLGALPKQSSSYQKPIGLNIYDNSLKERPEYVIVNDGGEKINSDFVYIADETNRGRLGYVFSGGDLRKGKTEYRIYDTDNKPLTDTDSFSIYNKGHQNSETLTPQITEPFNGRPHPVYGVPKEHSFSFDSKVPYDKNRNENDDSKSGSKNVHLVYAPEYDINLVPPATVLQVPKDLPVTFRSGFIGPSYLPPPDFHSSSKKQQNYNNISKPEHTSNTREYSSPAVQIIPNEVFDNSKLPLEDTKKHPHFDYQKTSYEVPLYNPAPFDSVTTPEELFPPNLSDIFNEENFPTIAKGSTKIEVTLPNKLPRNDSKEAYALNDEDQHQFSDLYSNQFSTFVNNLHSLSASIDAISEPPAVLLDDITTTSTVKPRKKKRTRMPNIKRHAIDISTLKKALIESELNSPNAAGTLYEDSFQKATAAPKNRTKQNFVLLSTVNHPKNIYEIQSWESTKLNKNDKSRIAEPDEVQVVSIQKSKSHSYYDGTIAPDTVKQLSLSERIDGQ